MRSQDEPLYEEFVWCINKECKYGWRLGKGDSPDYEYQMMIDHYCAECGTNQGGLYEG